MNWLFAALAPAVMAGILWATGRAEPAIGAYHATCVIGIILARHRIRPLLKWTSSTGTWAGWTTVVFLAGLAVPLLFWSPSTIREQGRAFFPWNDSEAAFAIFAAYTMIVHCPLEEIFWRGAVTDPAARLPVAVAGNAAFFYLLHAAAMGKSLGGTGWLLAIPAGLAGGGWAFVTARSRSLWPALLSHWAVDVAILWGMWFFFVRR
jgi:membrane protease YdiL (CAAX protease family)